MSVRGVFSLTDPDEADATLTLVMSVREWKQLAQQLSNDYPSWRVGIAISRLVGHAGQSFGDQVEIEP